MIDGSGNVKERRRKFRFSTDLDFFFRLCDFRPWGIFRTREQPPHPELRYHTSISRIKCHRMHSWPEVKMHEKKERENLDF